MNKATELLKEAGTFFVASQDGDQPRVRPFGAVAEFDGKTYICLNNTKKVFKQFMANPKIEITGMLKNGDWFRLDAKVNRDDRNDARAEFLKQTPLAMYKPDDGIYEVFYLTDVSGSIDSFTKDSVAF